MQLGFYVIRSLFSPAQCIRVSRRPGQLNPPPTTSPTKAGTHPAKQPKNNVACHTKTYYDGYISKDRTNVFAFSDDYSDQPSSPFHGTYIHIENSLFQAKRKEIRNYGKQEYA
jgi:hypothetical protein